MIARIAAVAMAVCVASPALAQQAPPCGPRAQLVKGLFDQYGEAPVNRGVQTGGALLEIYSNPETGTWTAVITRDSRSCIVSAGDGWDSVTHQAPGANS